MSFVEDNDAYEAWLAKQCDVDAGGVKAKHRLMKSSAFKFLRATYFRWAKQLPQICPELMDAPRLLCVGDLHVENFGTWRDADGRLVWGVNDFDEAAVMPYVLDLVRLATSALLARGAKWATCDTVCAAVAKGYAAGLRAPRPFVLDYD